MLLIFWLSIFLVVSSYFLYPIVVWIAGKLFPFNVKKREGYPFVSIIIPAFNEEKSIEKKIRNTLELNYPADRMEILVGSDGSTDNTPAIMNKLKSGKVLFFDFKENRGKTAVQNDLVDASSGEILIFTDAASFLQVDSLLPMVRNFADKRVGCVAGRMVFVDTEFNLTTQSQGLYWKYESNLRELESRTGSLIGVDGPLYAMRRKCYVPLPHHVISDFLSPLLVLKQHKKVVLEPEAVVYEEPTARSGQEFKTRRRVTLRGLVGLAEYPELLNPFKYPLLACQVFFHKLLRWFVGPLILINFCSSVLLAMNGQYLLMPVFYGVFGLFAAAGFFFERKGEKVRILTIPYYFTLVNLAATLGIVDFFLKRQAITWEPVRN